MASMYNDSKGNTILQFVGAQRRRHSIWLGQQTEASAIELKRHIEELLTAKRAGRAPFQDTVHWVSRIEESLYDKLEKKSLVPQRTNNDILTNLGELTERFMVDRSDMKGWTKTNYRQASRCLVGFFGADRPITRITAADADDWRRWLTKSKKEGGQGLADNTVRKRCAIARQIFRDAVRRGAMETNPFGDMKGLSVRPNRERDYFVSREDAAKVLACCPDVEWQVIFALARYGGLRTPSEVLALRWSDIDWVESKIRVVSSKTAHHAGKESRMIPLFPELRPYLDALRIQAISESKTCENDFVVTHYRSRAVNLRSRLLDIIQSAGLKKWPKLFMALRASRATELAREYAGHVAAAWMGHGTVVAQRHYWQVTADDFGRACRPPANQCGPDSGRNLHSTVHENVQTSSVECEAKDENPQNSGRCELLLPGASDLVLPVGLEPTTY
jgi:integrase